MLSIVRMMGITAMKTAVEHSTFCRNDMQYTEGHF